MNEIVQFQQRKREQFVFSYLKGRPLADWVVRYAECADVLALAREYLQAADDVQRRRRGLDVLRWAPASDMRINGTIIRIAIDDSDAGVRRYAVETLCGRDAVGALWEALANTTERGLRRRLSQAIGHARNLRGVGRRALAGVGLTDRLRVRMRSAVDLLALYRTAFAVTFALTALLFEVGTELYRFMHIIVRSVVASGSDGGLSLSYAFSETAIAITAVVGLGALLRRIIDERAAEPERWDLMRAGIIGGAISELIQIVARLAQETVNTFVRLAQGHVGISPTNFLFAFTDTLYTIAAMGVIALALKPIAAAPPRKTLMWRFAGFALLASVAGIVTSRLLLPLAYNLSGMNFRFEPSLETFVGEMLVSLLVSTVAGAAGLVGFRLALRIAFDDQAFPAWSVPEPNSTGRSDRMRRRSPVQCE